MSVASVAARTRAFLVAVSVASVLLAIAATWLRIEHRNERRAMDALIGASATADRISAQSDALLAGAFTPQAFDAYGDDVAELDATLDRLVSDVPGGASAQEALEALADSVRGHVEARSSGRDSAGAGVLGIDPEAARVMADVAALGVDLDDAMQSLVRGRRATLSRFETVAYGATIATAALLVLLAVGALIFLHHSMSVPITRLIDVVDRVAEGDRSVRAELPGRHEVARLGAAVDTMLDRIERSEGDLRAAKEAAERREEELSEAQWLLGVAARLVRFGGWYVDLDRDTIAWTDAVYDIHEIPRGEAIDVSKAIDFYAPHERDRIRTVFERAASEGVPYDEEFEFVTARGNELWIRTTGEAVRDEDGRIVAVQGGFQDIDRVKRAELEHRKLESTLRATIEHLRDVFLMVDGDGRVRFANAAALDFAGVPRSDEVQGRPLDEVLPPSLGAKERNALRRATAEGQPTRFETWDEAKQRWLEIWTDPGPEGMALGIRDVTSRHPVVERLLAREGTREQEAGGPGARGDALPSDIAVLDSEGRVVSVNVGWRETATRDGRTFDGIGRDVFAAGLDPSGCLPAESAERFRRGLARVLAGERARFQDVFRCPMDGEQRVFSLDVWGLGAGDAVRGACVARVDLTGQELARRALEQAAYHDPLTGVLSRDGLVRAVSIAVEKEGWPERAALTIVDLGGLRGINEAFGYRVGDDLLAAVADRLAAIAGDEGFVGRAHGDSFVVVLPAIEPTASPADAILDGPDGAFRDPFRIDGIELTVQPRIGYTRFADEPRPVATLLREAEVALHVAIESGTNVDEFDEMHDQVAKDRTRLTQELAHAIDADQLELHYQPKVDLATGRMVACEALVRWRHPERGLIAPGTFIPVAERSGLILPLGRWVLDEAARALRGWIDAGLSVVSVSVNVSVAQLWDGSLVSDVQATCERHGIDPARLVVEVTESVFARADEPLRTQLTDLADLGVVLSLDDFGTGYSSLALLKDYPFDNIKIDKAFVHGLPEDDYSTYVVRSVLAIADAKRAVTVAEGVERDEQRRALVEMGCPRGQGYLFSPPLSHEDFSWLLTTHPVLPLTSGGDAGMQGGRPS